MHRYHFYVEEGLPRTPVLLWVYDQEVRAIFDTVGVATYHCRYDRRAGTIHDLRPGSLLPTRFVSPQGSLIARTPQDTLVLYRPQPQRRPVRVLGPAPQLGLFAWMIDDDGCVVVEEHVG